MPEPDVISPAIQEQIRQALFDLTALFERWCECSDNDAHRVYFSSIGEPELRKALTDFVRAALAEQRAGWQPIDPENLPVGRVLLTNNLYAKDAHGNMSHIWIGFPIKSSEPEKYGAVVTFGDDWDRVSNLTHWRHIPAAPPLEEQA